MCIKNYILFGTLLFLLPSFLIWNAEEVTTDFCFDFDQVDYYHIEIDEQYDEDPDYMPDENADKAGYDKAQDLDNILIDSYPLTLKDTTFLIALTNSDYSLEKINKARHKELKALFCPSNNNKDKEVYMCMPLYRDILVFKQKNEFVGLAKICFSCDQIYLLNNNEVPFGLWFDLDLAKSPSIFEYSKNKINESQNDKVPLKSFGKVHFYYSKEVKKQYKLKNPIIPPNDRI
jgi:hypothetical protein